MIQSKNTTHQADLKDWKEDSRSLKKTFNFTDRVKAREFINKVEDISDALQHHARIEGAYTTWTFILSTHSAGDTVTEKDFELAGEIDKVAAGFQNIQKILV
jgi:4a-hydroxytetrahydrobiopterin dehydratase